jgi:hypothetical protein
MSDRQFKSQVEEAAYALGRTDERGASNREPLTVEQIKAMSQEEIVSRIDEVNEALKSPSKDGDNDDF